jgi:hypothetical protein
VVVSFVTRSVKLTKQTISSPGTPPEQPAFDMHGSSQEPATPLPQRVEPSTRLAHMPHPLWQVVGQQPARQRPSQHVVPAQQSPPTPAPQAPPARMQVGQQAFASSQPLSSIDPLGSRVRQKPVW